LLLRTEGPCDLDPEHLLDVMAEQRHRFAAVLHGFGSDDWACKTRCEVWSAHDVIRHLCDEAAIGGIGPDDHAIDMAAGFDPRVTPRERLIASAGESPDATLRRLSETTEELLALYRTRIARDRTFDVHLPYGTMDWTVLMLHNLWDWWLHERDVLLVRGSENFIDDDDGTFYVTAYGVFLAALMAPILGGEKVNERLELGGTGGGTFSVQSDEAVVLTADRGTTEGPPAAEVADALAGRPPGDVLLCSASVNSRIALSLLAAFFNASIDQDPL
jgi:hypothetical protein